jgi:thioredoxin reductase
LFEQLGCETSQKGAVRTKKRQRSSVAGVFVCGDAAEDSQYAVIAAAHGARAAMELNEELLREDLR